jgi:hypothetical protein
MATVVESLVIVTVMVARPEFDGSEVGEVRAQWRDLFEKTEDDELRGMNLELFEAGGEESFDWSAWSAVDADECFVVEFEDAQFLEVDERSERNDVT